LEATNNAHFQINTNSKFYPYINLITLYDHLQAVVFLSLSLHLLLRHFFTFDGQLKPLSSKRTRAYQPEIEWEVNKNENWAIYYLYKTRFSKLIFSKFLLNSPRGIMPYPTVQVNFNCQQVNWSKKCAEYLFPFHLVHI
jgi:hypothetical protein